MSCLRVGIIVSHDRATRSASVSVILYFLRIFYEAAVRIQSSMGFSVRISIHR
jgi:hypothetical protein